MMNTVRQISLGRKVGLAIQAIGFTASYSLLQDFFIYALGWALPEAAIDVLNTHPYFLDTVLTFPLLFLYGHLYWRWHAYWQERPLRLPAGLEAAKCILIACGVYGVSTLWFYFVDGFLMRFSFWQKSVSDFSDTWSGVEPGDTGWMWFTVVLLGPVVEELLFRGLVFNALRNIRPGWLPVVGSAVLFGLFHGEPVQVVYTCLMGLMVGVVYERTRRLDFAILIHIFNNFLSEALSYVPNEAVYSGAEFTTVLLIVPAVLLVVRTAQRREL